VGWHTKYMEGAAHTAQYPAEVRYAYVALGLAGVAGEVLDKVRLADRDLLHKKAWRRKVAEELGDVLWYWAMCCKEFETDPEEVAETLRCWDSDYPLGFAVEGLVCKSTLISNIVKKIYRDDNGVVMPKRRAQLKQELGLVLVFWTLCCRELRWDPEEIAKANLAKLAKRKAEGKIQGEGDNR